MKRRWIVVCLLASMVIALVFPATSPPPLEGAGGKPFRWDSHALFATLEAQMQRARHLDGASAQTEVETLGAQIDTLLAGMDGGFSPHDLDQLAARQFHLGALAAGKPELLERVRARIDRIRLEVLGAATEWDTDSPEVRDALYRVIYGGRATIEEALVQAGNEALDPLALLTREASTTPSTVVEGVRVHSGDIVLSRGGAPTSALIARGNDYPGNFSHVALVHVDPQGRAHVIESLIERGLVVSSLEGYLQDKKLRLLLLRLRREATDDPQLPDRVATEMLHLAQRAHHAYDFAMAWQEREAYFCSEVPYHPYRSAGVELWRNKSTMSAPGLLRWLAALGVRNSTTLVPSDLEYDPQLRLIAEWRNPETLRQDRRDNAIVDVLLEEAERGADLQFEWKLLPLARVTKAISILQDLFGATPIIPEGMNAATALRVKSLNDEIFARLRPEVERGEAEFHDQHGYPPPYWQLVELARRSFASRRGEMAPFLTAP